MSSVEKIFTEMQNKMRELVLTGCEEAWPNNEVNALFLGPWCFAHNRKCKFWEQKRFEIASSPWKSPQDLFEASLYIGSLFDRIMPKLAELMNTFYDIKHGEIFWKTYMSVWLLRWLEVCYDRYMYLACLGDGLGKKYTVKVSKHIDRYFTSYHDFEGKIGEQHDYNLYLMTDIINLGACPHLQMEEVEISASSKSYISTTDKSAIVNSVLANSKAVLRGWFERIFDDIVHSKLYLGNVVGMSIIDKMYLLLRNHPLFFLKWNLHRKALKIEANRHIFEQGELCFGALSNFEKLVEKLLLKYIPRDLLFLYVRNEDLDADDNIVKYWIGNDIFTSEEYACRIALLLEDRGRWLSVQHGAGYGQSMILSNAKIEYGISNGFITWGWKHSHIYNSYFVPLPSPKLSKLKGHKGKGEELLFIGTGTPPYMFQIDAHLNPEQILGYLLNKDIFLKNLDPSITSKVKYRPYFTDYGIGEREYLRRRLSASQFLMGGGLTAVMRKAKLIVLDHITTTHLEALTMNAPTILFCDPKHFALSSEAELYFNKLRNAGVFFDSAKIAAENVNKIWPDVQEWWRQSSIQNAKDEFCYQFARVSDSWRSEWSVYINGLEHKAADFAGGVNA